MGKEVVMDLSVNWTEFSLSYSCVIILMIVICMSLPRDTSYIRRVNAFGVVFISIFLIFILSNGIYSMTKTDYTTNLENYQAYKAEVLAGEQPDYVSYIPLAGVSFIPLMGILGGGFYFHNMALPLAANAANPQNTTRNIFLGFLCVFTTYSLVGVLGVYGFSGV